jgi:hypothetical protein
MMRNYIAEGKNPNPMVGATQDWRRVVEVNGDVAVAHSINNINGHKEHRGTIQFVNFEEVAGSIKDFINYKEEMFF